MSGAQQTAYGAAAFGRVASGFSWSDVMEGLYGKSDSLYQKATFTSSTAGINNRVYGQVLWQQANTATPLWGMLPKEPGDDAPNNISDPHPATFRAVYNPPEFSSQEEAGTWPDAVDFSFQEVDYQPRHSLMKFEASQLQQLFAQIQDGVPFENLTSIGEEYFRRSLEADGIARPVLSSTGEGTQYDNDTTIASIDRVIGSEDEESNATDVNGDAYADGDLDVYSVDRSQTGANGSNENGWADSVVDHNGGTPRQLTSSLMDDVIQAVKTNGANKENMVIYTGFDSARVLSDLRADEFRYDGMTAPTRDAVGNGSDDAQTRPGVATNRSISHWDGIPIVEGPHCPSDSLSRIYVLDMSTQSDPETGESVPKIAIETHIPMTTETAGLGQSTNTLAIDKLADQVGVLTTHEVACRRFNHQAKLRDLEQ